MNKIKIDNYYKPESKTLRLDELDYTIIPNSDIKPLLDKLQQENKRLNGAIQTYDILLKANVEENNQLKDNLNKLKEYIRKTKLKEFEKTYGKRYGKIFTQAEVIVCNMILDKMQELEQGSDSNE
jgi:hypothetical protein